MAGLDCQSSFILASLKRPGQTWPTELFIQHTGLKKCTSIIYVYGIRIRNIHTRNVFSDMDMDMNIACLWTWA